MNFKQLTNVYNIDNKLRLSDYYTNGNNVKISYLKLYPQIILTYNNYQTMLKATLSFLLLMRVLQLSVVSMLSFWCLSLVMQLTLLMVTTDVKTNQYRVGTIAISLTYHTDEFLINFVMQNILFLTQKCLNVTDDNVIK